MVRIQREPESNYKITDYVPRDSVNSVALHAFRENWCLVGTRRRNPKYVAICCSCKTQYLACLPLYRKEMRDLPQTHQEVYNEFINDNFTIRLKQCKADDVWSDLV